MSRIIKATYGAGGKFVDVTSILSKSIVENRGQLQINNAAMGGDPYHGVNKELHVIYDNGTKIVVPENSFINLYESKLPGMDIMKNTRIVHQQRIESNHTIKSLPSTYSSRKPQNYVKKNTDTTKLPHKEGNVLVIKNPNIRAKPMYLNKKIAILLQLANINLWKCISSYLNRLQYHFDLHVGLLDEQRDNKDLIHEISQCFKKVFFIFSENRGMDIGLFLKQIEYLQRNHIVYDYYLKLHSKTDEKWRTTMYESVLPTKNIDKVFELLETYGICGPNYYLFDLGSHYDEFIIDKICKFIPNVKTSDIYDIIEYSDKLTAELDPSFYVSYHKDLKICAERMEISSKIQFAKDHWTNYGKYEYGRCSHKKYIKSFAKRKYKFYAGTIFWFTNDMLRYFISHMDPIHLIYQSLETGRILNNVPRQTHSYEYWFGILASHFHYPKEIKGVNTLTFLIPQVDGPNSTELRTVFSLLSYLEGFNYIINIQLCLCDTNITIDEYRTRINNFNEIKNINRISICFDNEYVHSDLYVATGWQTFEKILYYGKHNKICFLCQDLEYLFPCFGNNDSLRSFVKDFYSFELPTFTISKFLGSTFKDSRYIASTSFNVNTQIYHHNKKGHRNGMCLVYEEIKPHRLPSLVLDIVNKLSLLLPHKNFYLFGEHQKISPNNKNVHDLGALRLNQIAELYNKCELGLCFSNSNPSRNGFEMVACGLPCIELDNEYTKYDLPNDVFIKVSPNLDEIVNKAVHYLNNPGELKALSNKCIEYAKNNFYPFKEQIAFHQFIVDVLNQ